MSTFNFEQLLVANELGEVIRLHNQAIERLKAFRESHPHLIAPNLARMAEENLKENVTVLYRELNNLHKPKSEQRRHVCRDCHNVFVVPLPGGICDECRSKLAAPSRPAYGARPHRPEAEAETLSDITPAPTDLLDETGPEESAPGETVTADSEPPSAEITEEAVEEQEISEEAVEAESVNPEAIAGQEDGQSPPPDGDEEHPSRNG